ncbi:WXG100 family type VII secretion target [Nocardia sp. NPDC004604]|uniref:WXG100 family type VII secretion target n=1 Tax=Nocardia sp. NPDC004604 TaxID=3157013 RepID=UPI0033A806E4
MSLQVDPAVLRQGASELRVQRGLLDDVLAGIRFEYSRLQEVWSGRSADYVTALWDGLVPRIGTHINELNRQATSLTTAADALVAQDERFSNQVTAKTSSLDLP